MVRHSSLVLALLVGLSSADPAAAATAAANLNVGPSSTVLGPGLALGPAPAPDLAPLGSDPGLSDIGSAALAGGLQVLSPSAPEIARSPQASLGLELAGPQALAVSPAPETADPSLSREKREPGLRGDPSGQAAPPRGADVLARARASEVGLDRVGEAILSARDPREALTRLAELKLASPGEFSFATPESTEDFWYLLQRLWFDAAPKAVSLEVDRSWAIPAVVVRAPDRTYYLHGVVHATNLDQRPVRPGLVRRLARTLEARSLPLYSEEFFGDHYGYGYGSELRHLSDPDRAPIGEMRPADRAGARVVTGALRWLSSPWALLALGALLWTHPASWLAWVGALAVAAMHVRIWQGARLRFLRDRFRAWRIGRLGREDLAHYAKALADVSILGRWLDPLEFFRIRLPLPLKAAAPFPDEALRASLGMARSLSADAAAKGHREIHVLTGGHRHLVDLFWALGRQRT